MKKNLMMMMTCMAMLPASLSAQVNAADSVMEHASGNRLSVGGYGEAAFSRNFYRDNHYR